MFIVGRLQNGAWLKPCGNLLVLWTVWVMLDVSQGYKAFISYAFQANLYTGIAVTFRTFLSPIRIDLRQNCNVCFGFLNIHFLSFFVLWVYLLLCPLLSYTFCRNFMTSVLFPPLHNKNLLLIHSSWRKND